MTKETYRKKLYLRLIVLVGLQSSTIMGENIISGTHYTGAVVQNSYFDSQAHGRESKLEM